MSIWFGADSLCSQDVVRGEDEECILKTGDLKNSELFDGLHCFHPILCLSQGSRKNVGFRTEPSRLKPVLFDSSALLCKTMNFLNFSFLFSCVQAKCADDYNNIDNIMLPTSGHVWCGHAFLVLDRLGCDH